MELELDRFDAYRLAPSAALAAAAAGLFIALLACPARAQRATETALPLDALVRQAHPADLFAAYSADIDSGYPSSLGRRKDDILRIALSLFQEAPPEDPMKLGRMTRLAGMFMGRVPITTIGGTRICFNLELR
ncbi:MAG: hypothetical protein HY078_02315 [Elusimicrobia bacterium]|nr:hypothetical protein [Elusimicrobiota bacterium]